MSGCCESGDPHRSPLFLLVNFMVTIEVRADRLLDILDEAGAVQALRPAVERSVLRVQAYMAKYPAKRAGSNYKRGHGMRGGAATSENLGKKWTTQITGGSDEIIGEVGNDVSYGPFVQSDAFQAGIHRELWQTDADAVEELQPAIIRDFERTIDALLGG